MIGAGGARAGCQPIERPVEDCRAPPTNSFGEWAAADADLFR
jgi:hypothetical protein